MFPVLQQLIHFIQPILVPLCFIVAWMFLLSLALTIYGACKDTAERAKVMHSIPCARCTFFTNDYRLKCTVNPSMANTEAAIDCIDYRQK